MPGIRHVLIATQRGCEYSGTLLLDTYNLGLNQVQRPYGLAKYPCRTKAKSVQGRYGMWWLFELSICSYRRKVPVDLRANNQCRRSTILSHVIGGMIL